jgi:hypothetical protein
MNLQGIDIMNKEKQVDIDLAIIDFLDAHDKKKDYTPLQIIKWISKKTGVSEYAIADYLIVTGIIARFNDVKARLLEHRKTNKDYNEICKALENKEGNVPT